MLMKHTWGQPEALRYELKECEGKLLGMLDILLASLSAQQWIEMSLFPA
jgi:hypothetical protein